MKERRKEVKAELLSGRMGRKWAVQESIRTAVLLLNSRRWPLLVTIVILVIIGMTENSTAPDSPATDSWTLANAKARLSEVIDRAQAGPQIITRHGKPNAVIVSAEEWARKTARKGTLAEFLLASPLRSADLELERVHDAPHDETP
jgi:prevent-host-death family protein